MAEQPTVGEACQVCGQRNPSTIERHHIVPDRFGGSDHPDNMVSLCGSCHNAIEAIYDDSFYQRLQQAGVPIKFPEEAGGDGGHELESPHHSVDRPLPQDSPHYHGELLPIALDGPKPAVERVDKPDDVDWEDISDEEFMELDSEWVADEDIWTGEMPEFIKTAAKEHSGDFARAIVIHCGYCNKVYGAHQQSLVARHLQIEHNIENPYEYTGEYEKQQRDSISSASGDRVFIPTFNQRGLDKQAEKIPQRLFTGIEKSQNEYGFPKRRGDVWDDKQSERENAGFDELTKREKELLEEESSDQIFGAEWVPPEDTDD